MRLQREAEKFRDWREDRQSQALIPRVAPDEFLHRFQLADFVWPRWAAEFGEDVGLPVEPDRLFLFSFVQALKPARFLEIGTWRGGTSAVIKTVSPGTEVTTINFPDPTIVTNPLAKEEIGRAFRRRNISVELIWEDSGNLPRLGLKPFDMIFVDGDHREEPALRDMENSWRLLQPNGWLLLHDFVQPDLRPRTPEQRWVVRAYRTFLKRHGSEFAEQFQFSGSWIAAIKKAG